MLVCLFVCFLFRGILNKFEAKFVLFDETANKGKMNKDTNEKNCKKFFCKMSAKRRGYNNDKTHRNSQQNISLFAKQTQSQIKTEKKPEIRCFRGRDIAFTRYQKLVILHIIDGCQT